MENYLKKQEYNIQIINKNHAQLEGNFVFCNVLSEIIKRKIMIEGISLIKNRDKFLEKIMIKRVGLKELELHRKLVSFCLKFSDLNKTDLRNIQQEDDTENLFIQSFLKTKRLPIKKKYKPCFGHFKDRFKNEYKFPPENIEKSYIINYNTENELEIIQNNEHIQEPLLQKSKNDVCTPSYGRSNSINIESSIDIVNLPKCIKILGKNIKYANRKKELKKDLIFVFSNINLKLIELSHFSWRINIVKLNKWVGFGIGNKDNFHSTHKFLSEEKVNLNMSNPCCLAVTSGGILWNHLDLSRNHEKIENFPQIKENDYIAFVYSKYTLQIDTINNFSFVIDIPANSYTDPKINFYPFIVLNPGCEISFS